MYNKQLVEDEFESLIGFNEDSNIKLGRQTSGELIVGKTYKIVAFEVGDDFINVGAASNANGITFTAINATPTAWNNLSELQDLQLVTSESGCKVNNLAISLKDVESCIPIDNVTNELTESVTDFLLRNYNSFLHNFLNNFINKSKLLCDSKSLVQNSNVINTYNYTLKSQVGDFVGYLIALQNSNNLQMIIDLLQIQLNEQDTFTIFLYDIDKSTAIATFEFNCAASYDKISKQVTDFIMFANDNESSNKTYLIGFYEYNSENPQSLQLNSTNQLFEYYYFDIAFKPQYSAIIPIRIAKEHHNFDGTTYKLPTKAIDNYNVANPCFNLKFRVEPDYTNIIINNYLLFANCFNYHFNVELLNYCINSERFNQITESKSDNQWNDFKNEYERKLNGFEMTNGSAVIKNVGILDELVYSFQNIDNMLFKRLMWGI